MSSSRRDAVSLGVPSTSGSRRRQRATAIHPRRTGCSEFQDWQSIGVFSSADAVGQRGVITRIASGCRPQQEASIRHAMSHLPARCRVFFAPDTDVKDHAGRYYKYANKPLGMMKWLQAGSVPPTATVALIDPDFFFLRPLWRGPASAIVASTA